MFQMFQTDSNENENSQDWRRMVEQERTRSWIQSLSKLS